MKKLCGKWQWLETSGGFGGMIQNPQSEGYAVTIEFGRKNKYKEWKNSDNSFACRYSLSKGKSVKEGAEEYLIYFRDQKTKAEKALPVTFSFVGKDTLVLTENVHDGFVRTFVRTKK